MGEGNGKLRVLAVDDDEDFAFMVPLLEGMKKGLKVVPCFGSNAVEKALQKLEDEDFDGLITDCRMSTLGLDTSRLPWEFETGGELVIRAAQDRGVKKVVVWGGHPDSLVCLQETGLKIDLMVQKPPADFQQIVTALS